ncbi:hypothetical protein TNCV_3667731 [Trichonephila clavipes]|nr:hypothetical protein TNCV_3667731 [Trichonephila clavipes]
MSEAMHKKLYIGFLIREVPYKVEHAQYPLIRYDDICSNVNCQHGAHFCSFPGQYNIKRDGSSGAPYDKTEYRCGTTSSFQTSPGSACSILMAVYVVWRL